MIFLNLAINIFSSLLQVIIVSVLLKTHGTMRKENPYWNIVCIIIFSLINGVLYTFNPIQIVSTILTIIFLFAYSYLYKLAILKRVFIIAIVSILLILFEVITGLFSSLIHNVSIEQGKENIGIYIQCALSSKVILISLVMIYSHFKDKNNIKLQWQTILLLLSLPIASFVVISVLSIFVFASKNMANIISVAVSSIVLLISNLLVFLVYNYIETQKVKENQMAVQAKQLELEKQFYYETTQKYILANKTYHDLKNKLFAIEMLLDTDNQLAREEISKTCQMVEVVQSLKYTNNDAIDALLNAKINIAKENGIEIKVISLISTNLNINPLDLCIVLGNILDNAINATKEVATNRLISFEIKQVEDRLSIKVVNSVNVDAENRKVKNKYLHGYGLNNVKEIVEKYDGNCRYGIINNEFIINIII